MLLLDGERRSVVNLTNKQWSFLICQSDSSKFPSKKIKMLDIGIDFIGVFRSRYWRSWKLHKTCSNLLSMRRESGHAVEPR